MTTIEHGTEGHHAVRSGRPLLFRILLLPALLATFVVLLAGPFLPLGGAVGLAAGAMVLVALGWGLAGPRW
ncbi:MAG: hypothetical protein Q4G40_06825 [Brachybacterium sp.]|nr:hypothetical protein [Brachybacterium sp.]